ncbi:MAG: hypothetical protein AB7O52_15385 [Planctomycetota bacterium]
MKPCGGSRIIRVGCSLWLLWLVGCRSTPDFSNPTFQVARNTSPAPVHVIDAGEPEPGLAFETLKRWISPSRLAFAVAPFTTDEGPDGIGEALSVAIARQLAQTPFTTTWHGDAPSLGNADASSPAPVFVPATPNSSTARLRIGVTGVVRVGAREVVDSGEPRTEAHLDAVVQFFGLTRRGQAEALGEKRLALSTFVTQEQVRDAAARESAAIYVLIRGVVSRLLRDAELEGQLLRFAILERDS